MSQKAARRSRRHTSDDDSTFKAPTPKSNGDTVEESPQQQPEEPAETVQTQEEPKIDNKEPKTEQNGTETDSTETDSGVVTRSRSMTPQKRQLPPMNGHEEEEKVNKEDEKEEEKIETEHEKPNEDLNVSGKETETETEMDPLVLSGDEPDPELVFEENSDLESGRSSPVLTRCMTRRSINRNIPTPRTPKCAEESDDVSPSPIDPETTDKDDQDLNATFESCTDDVSTKAEAGSDSTRLDYMNRDLSNSENTFLQEAKNKSFGETLRHLSTRRTIRPLSDDYRRRLLKANLDKTDYSATYPSRNSIERISSVGIKRKNSERDDGYTKRFKSEQSGFFSKITSPLSSIRNTFRNDIPSSTPKLTGYKDEKFMLEDEGISSKMYEVQEGERRWCSIM